MPSPAITARAAGRPAARGCREIPGRHAGPWPGARLDDGAGRLCAIGQHRGKDWPASAARAARSGLRMHRQQMLDRRAGRRLPAFVQPGIGHHRREIGPPHAGHEDRAAGRGHRARGRAEDIGQAGLGVALGADSADPPAWASITPAATGVPARRPSSAAARAVRPFAQRRARSRRPLADARESLVRQHAQADRPEVALVPATFVRQVGPFAGDRAGRPRKIAVARQVRKSVRSKNCQAAAKPLAGSRAATAASASPSPARSGRRHSSAPRGRWR